MLSGTVTSSGGAKRVESELEVRAGVPVEEDVDGVVSALGWHPPKRRRESPKRTESRGIEARI